MRGVHCPQCLGYRNISAYTVKGHEENIMESTNKKFTIAVAGTGYVGLSIATLLSQHHKFYVGRVSPQKIHEIEKAVEAHLGLALSSTG